MMAGHKPPYTLDEIYAVAQAGDILRAREMFNASVRLQSREAAWEASTPVETARLITVDQMLFEAYKQDSILLDSVEDDGLTLRKALAQAKAAREGLVALVDAILHDHAKYPQLRLPDMQYDRVKRLAAWLKEQGDRRDA